MRDDFCVYTASATLVFSPNLPSSQSIDSTWEWLPGAQIRSCLHPLLFAGFYHLLKARMDGSNNQNEDLALIFLQIHQTICR